MNLRPAENKIKKMKNADEKTPIYELRQKRGWTQQQLAEATDLSVKMVSKLENGDTKIAHYALAKIAAAFGCKKSELLGEEPPEQLSAREKAFLEMFRNLSEREQDGIMAAFNVLAKPAPDKKAGSE